MKITKRARAGFQRRMSELEAVNCPCTSSTAKEAEMAPNLPALSETLQRPSFHAFAQTQASPDALEIGDASAWVH
jgi:hypothetical protein